MNFHDCSPQRVSNYWIWMRIANLRSFFSISTSILSIFFPFCKCVQFNLFEIVILKRCIWLGGIFYGHISAVLSCNDGHFFRSFYQATLAFSNICHVKLSQCLTLNASKMYCHWGIKVSILTSCRTTKRLCDQWSVIIIAEQRCNFCHCICNGTRLYFLLIICLDSKCKNGQEIWKKENQTAIAKLGT